MDPPRRGSWTEHDGTPGTLDVSIELPDGHESLNVVIPWNDERSSTTPPSTRPDPPPASSRSATGAGDRRRRGRRVGCPRRRARPLAVRGHLELGWWRRPVSATTSSGLQFGAKWTEGSGYTENGLIVDGRLTKLGRELDWTYDWDEPLTPWRVVDPGGQLDVTLSPATTSTPSSPDTTRDRRPTRSSAPGRAACAPTTASRSKSTTSRASQRKHDRSGDRLWQGGRRVHLRSAAHNRVPDSRAARRSEWRPEGEPAWVAQPETRLTGSTRRSTCTRHSASPARPNDRPLTGGGAHALHPSRPRAMGLPFYCSFYCAARYGGVRAGTTGVE